MYGGNGGAGAGAAGVAAAGTLPETGGAPFWSLLLHDPATFAGWLAHSWGGALVLFLSAFALIAAAFALWRIFPRRGR